MSFASCTQSQAALTSASLYPASMEQNLGCLSDKCQNRTQSHRKFGASWVQTPGAYPKLRVDCEAMTSAICIMPGISLHAQKVITLCSRSKEPNMFVELARQLKQQVWIRVPTSICRDAWSSCAKASNMCMVCTCLQFHYDLENDVSDPRWKVIVSTCEWLWCGCLSELLQKIRTCRAALLLLIVPPSSNPTAPPGITFISKTKWLIACLPNPPHIHKKPAGYIHVWIRESPATSRFHLALWVGEAFQLWPRNTLEENYRRCQWTWSKHRWSRPFIHVRDL